MSERRAALRVLGGATARGRHVMAPHTQLRVGRDAECDVSLPRDPELSDEHFSITWDGERGQVTDLGSRRGTLVAGSPVTSGTVIAHGGWIRAGSTDFRLEVEDALAPRADAQVASPWREPAAEAERGRLWAIVDASRGDAALALLRTSMDAGRSLYEGIQGEALETVAPHLVKIEPSSRLLGRIAAGLAPSGVALFFASDESDKALRRHLRRFLVVEAEGIGPRTYFRFYDPAVFGPFWQMATLRQRAELSRDIDTWWVPVGPQDLTRIDVDAEHVGE